MFIPCWICTQLTGILGPSLMSRQTQTQASTPNVSAPTHLYDKIILTSFEWPNSSAGSPWRTWSTFWNRPTQQSSWSSQSPDSSRKLSPSWMALKLHLRLYPSSQISFSEVLGIIGMPWLPWTMTLRSILCGWISPTRGSWCPRLGSYSTSLRTVGPKW